ncbi:hypothetical protein [Undibacterium sp.]|uniref:hypothetical protein n=1 Tax=Undibacterium sp. TaxID=1914977 RepID=UPI00374D0ED2
MKSQINAVELNSVRNLGSKIIGRSQHCNAIVDWQAWFKCCLKRVGHVIKIINYANICKCKVFAGQKANDALKFSKHKIDWHSMVYYGKYLKM